MVGVSEKPWRLTNYNPDAIYFKYEESTLYHIIFNLIHNLTTEEIWIGENVVVWVHPNTGVIRIQQSGGVAGELVKSKYYDYEHNIERSKEFVYFTIVSNENFIENI